MLPENLFHMFCIISENLSKQHLIILSDNSFPKLNFIRGFENPLHKLTIPSDKTFETILKNISENPF